MPVSCVITFPKLSETQMRALDYRVMGHVFEIHRELGCLCDESVYQNRLSANLANDVFSAACEVPVLLSFRSFRKILYLDLVVNQSVIYELKTVTKLSSVHVNQLLNYLFLTNSTHGKLINFRRSSVESQFVNATLDLTERRRFCTVINDWKGPVDFLTIIEELVLDWGTGLDQSLYTEAVVHSLGGAEAVTQPIPMQLDGVSLGKQRFHLCTAETAFRITTFQKANVDSIKSSIRKLLAASPLNAIHWVNIARHGIHLRTIAKH